MKICPKCGTRSQDNDVFCSNCGMRFKIQVKESDNIGQCVGSSNERTKIIALAVLICALLIGCIVVGIKLFADTKEGNSDEQLTEAKQYLDEKDHQHAAGKNIEAVETSPNSKKTYVEPATAEKETADPERLLFEDYYNKTIAKSAASNDLGRKEAVLTSYDLCNLRRGCTMYFYVR